MKSKKRIDPKQSTIEEIDDLKKGLAELGLSSSLISKFTVYLNFLYDFQGKINLVSKSDYHRISRRHFLVSLIAYPYLIKSQNIADLGSGAGFPGLPLKIVLPEIDFVLIESMQKRAKFLMMLIKKLELNRISVFADRAENYLNNGFDTILLRAVGSIKSKLPVINRLLSPDGQAIFYKSLRVRDEIKDAQALMERLDFAFKVEQCMTPVERRPMMLVILKKTVGTKN